MTTYSFSRGFRQHDPVTAGTSGAAESKAARAEEKVRALSDEIERLLMITEALWEILKEQHGYTDDDLAHKIRDIDLRDGKLDSRVAPSGVAQCPTCNRTLEKNRSYCIYCGQAVTRDPFER